jgi:hypothetical protein
MGNRGLHNSPRYEQPERNYVNSQQRGRDDNGEDVGQDMLKWVAVFTSQRHRGGELMVLFVKVPEHEPVMK